MSEFDEAAAAAIGVPGRFAAVTGRTWRGAEAVVDAAALHVVAPGPTTRIGVAAGMALGGHRCVTLIDDYAVGVLAVADAVAVTTAQNCAADALRAGWSVVQPWAGADLAALLDTAPRPAMVLLRSDASTPIGDPPEPRRSRLWFEGDAATLIGSGPAVGPMVHLAERLHARGVDAAVVEVATLTSPAQAALVGGTTLLVAGRHTSARFRAEAWPDDHVTALPLDGAEEADLIGMVLSVVSARR